MKLTSMMTGALALSLVGTGCATKKYVAKTVAPVEQRVTGTETKNGEQDKQIASQGTQIQEMGTDLSRTKEKLSDTDNKATQAGQAAQAADQKAQGAQQAADGARQAADGARSFAEQGITRLDNTVASMNKFQMVKTESVLFAFNSDKLTDDGKAQLDGLAGQAKPMNRFVVEVQGFTDKSGNATYNDTLSEARAQAVARYLSNQQIPVRNLSILGSGYAQPVGDDKTRDGRKMNRRVEVRLWAPEDQSATKSASAGGEQ
jgi:outer membrane protein OmpA-like peptidoglycan-associated protein